MANAVPDLEYGEVAVVMFPAGGANVQAVSKTQLFGSVQAATPAGEQSPISLASVLAGHSDGDNTITIIVMSILLTALWLILRLLSRLFRGATSARRFNARL